MLKLLRVSVLPSGDESVMQILLPRLVVLSIAVPFRPTMPWTMFAAAFSKFCRAKNAMVTLALLERCISLLRGENYKAALE